MIIPYDSLMEILEHSFDGIWITDGKGRILYANTANAALLGVSKRDLEGKTTQELLDEHIFSDSVILRTLKTGQRATPPAITTARVWTCLQPQPPSWIVTAISNTLSTTCAT